MSFQYTYNDQQHNPNILINGDMAIAQRGTGPFTTSATVQYSCDRWGAYRQSFATNLTTSQQSGSGINGLPSFLRLQRTSGDTSTNGINNYQYIEPAVARKYQGRTLTLSFWARVGANFSGSNVSVVAYSGTGTNEFIGNGFTGQTTMLMTTINPTTSFAQYVFTLTVPSNCNEIAIGLGGYGPTGTAGANDYVDITGCLLTEGALQPYRGAGATFEDEFAMCQRYCEFPPATCGRAIATNGVGFSMAFQVTKFKNPTMTIPGGVLNGVQSGVAAFTISSFTESNINGGTTTTEVRDWQIEGSISTSITASQPVTVYGGQILADAEIY